MKNLTTLIISFFLFTNLLSSQTISVDPDSLYQYLLPGESAAQTFTIANNGNDTLYYSIEHQSGCGDYYISNLPFTDTGSNVGMGDDWPVSNGLYQSEDVAYTFNVSQTVTIDVSLCAVATNYDCKVEIFTNDDLDCLNPVSTGYYDDDGPDCDIEEPDQQYEPSLITDCELSPGQYYIVVDGFNGATGNYGITVTESVFNGRSFSMDASSVENELNKMRMNGIDDTSIRLFQSQFNNVFPIQIPNERNTYTRDSRDIMIVIDPDSGMVAPGESTDISISMSVSSDDPGGIYNSYINILSNDPINSSVSVYLTLEVPDFLPPNPPDSLTAAPEYGYISLAWDAPEAGLHKYNIYKGSSISTITLIDSVVGSPPETIYQDQNVTVNELYYYQVSAVDQAGNEGALTDTVGVLFLPPNPPDNLTAAQEYGYISLAWDAPEAGLHKYNIYKGSSISTITLIDSVVGSPPETIYQDQNAIINELYYYQVSAVDQAGNEGALSDTLIAMISVNLVINEIMQNPSLVPDADGEWFEIYNKSNVNVPLQNWTIKDTDDEIHTITSGSIPIGSYFVFGNNSNTSVNGGVTIDYNYGTEISLSNFSDELILISPNNELMDSVAWDNGATFPDPNGASMALLDPNLDNSLGSNWVESMLTYGNGDYGTPGGLNFFSDITLNLMEIDFDTVNVNESGVLSLNISNEGNMPLQLDSLYTNSTLFTLLFTDSLIETSAELEVTFTPTELGQVTGTLYIVSNDPDESMVEVPLSGFGYYPAPDIELESTSLDFGGVMDGLTAMELFRVYNIGDAPLEIDTVYCTGNFSVMPGSGTVDATGNLELEVTFSPNDETSFTGTMTIVAGNDPDEDTLTVSLSGTGIAPGPDIAVSQEPLYFGVEIVPGDTITKQLVIYNSGLLTLEIEEIDITNSDANAPFWTGFEDAVIEPGDSVVIDVSFTTADAIHSASGSAIIYNNASNFSFSLIAGYILKIENITTEPNATDTVDIFFNNDTEIIQLWFTISGFDDFSQLSVLNVINTDWAITNNFVVYDWHLTTNNDLLINIGDFNEILEAGNGPIVRMVIHNNYQTDQMADLHFVNGQYMDTDWVGYGYDSNLLRSGTITIVDPPPSVPTGLSAEFNDGILLIWNENNEDDFSHYVLDKDTDDSFQTGQYLSITTTETSYLDTVYEEGQVLYYRLSAVDSEDNVSDFSETLSFEVVLSVNDENMIPDVFALHQNYPNPFNPITTLRYDLPEQANVNIIIYDMLGRQVKTLINQTQDPGYKTVIWNATNDYGKPVSAGVYLYKIQAGKFVQTKKMVLLK